VYPYLFLCVFIFPFQPFFRIVSGARAPRRLVYLEPFPFSGVSSQIFSPPTVLSPPFSSTVTGHRLLNGPHPGWHFLALEEAYTIPFPRTLLYGFHFLFTPSSDWEFLSLCRVSDSSCIDVQSPLSSLHLSSTMGLSASHNRDPDAAGHSVQIWFSLPQPTFLVDLIKLQMPPASVPPCDRGLKVTFGVLIAKSDSLQ